MLKDVIIHVETGPCHHRLKCSSMSIWLRLALRSTKAGPLFHNGSARGWAHCMTQADAYRMIERRTCAAGIRTKIGNHSLGATGITDYLKNGGTLENALAMANHSSPRTTKLYLLGA